MLNPADAVEAEKATEAMMQYIGLVLLRQAQSPTPMRIFTEGYPFDIGMANLVKEGRDATIIATGYMLTEAIKAVDLLEADGLDVAVLEMCTLKPLDEDAIVAAAKRTGAIVTAENCSDTGGLADGVAAVLAEHWPTPLVKVAVEDEFSQSGLITAERDELMEHFALRTSDIAEAVRACVEKRAAFSRR